MTTMPRLSRACFVAVCLWSFACATPQASTTASTARTPSAAAATVERRLPAQSGEPGVAVGTHAAVASAEPQASAVALSVLRSGGNAVDAAVALAFALAVTHPSAGNLAGGGFMLLRTATGENVAIDYRETAPAAASRDMYLDAAGNLSNASVLGARAAGVPGTVAGLRLAHERYGKTPWAELVQPAVMLARDGHRIDAAHAQTLARAVAQMHSAGFESSARVYSNAEGKPIAEGELWQQPELAQTLSEVAADPESFYTGPLAAKLVEQMQKAGGLWSARDLAEYRALIRPALQFTYRGYEITTMPPPSAGGVVMRQISDALPADG